MPQRIPAAAVRLAAATTLASALAPGLPADVEAIGYAALRAEVPDLPAGENLALLVGDFTSANTNWAWAVDPAGELAHAAVGYLPARSRPAKYSPHATGVATTIAGHSTGLLPALAALTSVHSEYYCASVLNVGRGIMPDKPRWDLEVHTWNWSDEVHSLELVRRMDWRVDRQGVTVVEALSNGRDTRLPYVFTSGYNVITVGVTAGTHSSGLTAFDGAGRTKPDLVVPTEYTSGATPLVAGAAALLIAQAKRTEPLAAARDPRVVKALLLAGATKEPIPSWLQTPNQPLDEHYGAGQLNLAHSYRMLVAGRQPAGRDWLPPSGWDLGTSGPARYFLEVPPGGQRQFSAVLVWHRAVTPTGDWQSFSASLADLNLRLSAATGEFVPVRPLAESRSRVDNVEHIYLPALPPGRYVLEVAGESDVVFGLAWRTGAGATVARPAGASGAPLPVVERPSFAVGMSAEQIRAQAGPPVEVKRFRRRGVEGEVWRYEFRRAVFARTVPTGSREVPRIDPVSGASSLQREPILAEETTYLHETFTLLLVAGKVAELLPDRRVSREIR